MNKEKIKQDLQEMLKKMERENKVDDIIRSNYTLSNVLSAMYYFSKSENDVRKLGIDIIIRILVKDLNG